MNLTATTWPGHDEPERGYEWVARIDRRPREPWRCSQYPEGGTSTISLPPGQEMTLGDISRLRGQLT